MEYVSRIITGIVLIVALLISLPFHCLSKGVGLLAYAFYNGFEEGWYRAKKFYY